MRVRGLTWGVITAVMVVCNLTVVLFRFQYSGDSRVLDGIVSGALYGCMWYWGLFEPVYLLWETIGTMNSDLFV